MIHFLKFCFTVPEEENGQLSKHWAFNNKINKFGPRVALFSFTFKNILGR